MSLKKGQTYEGTVSGYKFPNKGKVILDDHIVYVKDTLPGQEIRFRLSKKRQGSSEGKLIEVLKRSELESSTPVCSHFGDCGGCMYQRLSYDDQLKLKAQMVQDLIGRVYDEYEFDGITGSPDMLKYRNKMEFSFGDECKDGPFALGLHRKGSFHDIVDIHDCALVDDDINTLRNTVRDYFNEYYISGRIDFNHQYSHRGYLRHLLIRRSVSTKELLIALITTTPDMSDCLNPDDEQAIIAGFTRMLLDMKLEGKIAGICHVYNNALSDTVKNEDMIILYGTDHITEEVLGLKFNISLFSFFQTNTRGAEVLYSIARKYAGFSEDDTSGSDKRASVIYDLYSGTGTIAQLMSRAADQVIGIEIVEDAVISAARNAELNGTENVRFICGDVMKMLCGEEGADLPRPDFIMLDPPREGVHPKALAKIIDYAVENIVYISCKPTSLSNDLESFKQAGYILKNVSCVDMFPMTAHVEAVVLMTKVK